MIFSSGFNASQDIPDNTHVECHVKMMDVRKTASQKTVSFLLGLLLNHIYYYYYDETDIGLSAGVGITCSGHRPDFLTTIISGCVSMINRLSCIV